MKKILLCSLRLWMLTGLLGLGVHAYSQENARKITFSKFTLKENVNQNGKGITGLELGFDVFFNWEEREFFKQNFNVNFRLEQDGRTILQSSDLRTKPSDIFARLEAVGGKPGMAARGQKIFIPYLEIPLENGLQKADIVFSLSNDDGTYTDCFRTALTWQHKMVVRHSLNDQVFDFQNIVVDYAAKAFATQIPGMQVSADIGLKYGPEECLESSYDMVCAIRLQGRDVFDSRTSTQHSDKTKRVDIAVREGKPATRTSFFVSYHDLKMDGPGEVELVFIILGAEGGPKKVFSQKMTLDVPVKYNFEEQAFKLEAVKVESSVRDGVQGVSVHYACGFKHTTVLKNPEKGQYYFYLALFDANGKLIIDPARAPKHGAGTAHLLDGHLPTPTDTVARGQLFIPYYLLTTAPGSQQVKYALMVSDINLGTKFPVITQGSTQIEKPQERQCWVELEQLDVIDANYDAEFIPPGTHLPELQYVLCVGDDIYYESDYHKNSLSAVPGGVLLRLSAGDEINMKLYDVDSGFFNASDLQGKWKLDYQGKTSPFLYEVNEQGQVKKLRVKVDLRN